MMATLPKPKLLRSWIALQEEFNTNTNSDRWDGWLFRGQIMEEQDRRLPSVRTSLERSMKRFGVPAKEARRLEWKLLRDFKRRCHLVSSYIPLDKNKMEWLALFRHFGGPSRLSDWTYSVWAAVYFALDRANVVKHDKDICEVWALNARHCQKLAEARFPNVKKKLKQSGSNSLEEGNALFRITNKPGLWTMNAFHLNERLSIQQGAFLIPTDVTKPFTQNLLAVAPKNLDDTFLAIYRISLNLEEVRKCLKGLHRMNLTRATLYPGLEGLAQSLENAIGMPHLFHNVSGDLATGPF